MPFTELRILIFHLSLDHLQRKKLRQNPKHNARLCQAGFFSGRSNASRPQAGMRAAAQGPGESSASSESDRRYDSPK